MNDNLKGRGAKRRKPVTRRARNLKEEMRYSLREISSLQHIGNEVDEALLYPGEQPLYISQEDVIVQSEKEVLDTSRIMLGALDFDEEDGQVYLPANSVLISAAEKELRAVMISEPLDCVLGPGVLAITPKETMVLPRYLTFLINSQSGDIMRTLDLGDLGSHNMMDLLDFDVWIPRDLSKQKELLSNFYRAQEESYIQAQGHLLKAIDFMRGHEGREVILLLLVLKEEGVLELAFDRWKQSDDPDFKLEIEFSKQHYSESSQLLTVYDGLKYLLESLPQSIQFNVVSELLKLDQGVLTSRGTELFDDILDKLQYLEGKKGSYHMLPRNLSALMRAMGEINKPKKIYNPFAGLASFGVELPRSSEYYGQELQTNTWLIGLLRLIAYKTPLSKVDYQQSDSIEKWPTKTQSFDLVISAPPFGLRMNQPESEFRRIEPWLLQSSLELLSSKGRAVFLLPTGVLIEGGKAKSVRKKIVDENLLEAVIKLPGRVLYNTSISTNIVVLQKRRQTKTIRFINASEFINDNSEIRQHDNRAKSIDSHAVLAALSGDESEVEGVSKLVSYEEVAENDYVFDVNRYLLSVPELDLSEGAHMTPLMNLLGDSKLARPSVGKNYKVVGSSQLNKYAEELVTDFASVESILFDEMMSSRYRVVSNPSLLLARIGLELKPIFFKGEDIAINPLSVEVFEVNQELVEPLFLVNELSKQYVNLQVQKYGTGTAIRRLNKKDLANIKVAIPDLKKQRSILDSERSLQFQKKREELEASYKELNLDVADQLSALRHELAGTLRNARRTMEKLEDIVLKKVRPDVPLILDYRMTKDSSLSLGRCIEIIQRDMRSITRTVKRAGKEVDLVDFEPESIPFIRFCRNYAEELRNSAEGKYRVRFDLDEDSLNEEKVKEIFVFGDPDLLRKAFDNLIENAERHAFSKGQYQDENGTGKGQKDEIWIMLMFDFRDLTVQVDFSNTGHPLPKGFSLERYTRNGGRLGPESGDGYGGYFIDQVMKKHNGELSFTDETTPAGLQQEEVTTFELTFPFSLTNY